MSNNRFLTSVLSRHCVSAAAFALAVWGGQACASDDGIRPIADMHAVHGPVMAMNGDSDAHAAMQHGGMPGMSDSMPEDMHAHHHQMMHRQGYERSMHDYSAPDLELVDMNGRTTTLQQALDANKPVMMNFIFTTCTTICPVLSATFSQVQQELGDEIRQVQMVSITIDPEQDTPQQLKRYADRYDAGSQWRFFTGDRDNIIAVEKAFDIYRGSKSNHEPITLLRGAGGNSWVRLDGIASASDIIGEYRKLDVAGR